MEKEFIQHYKRDKSNVQKLRTPFYIIKELKIRQKQRAGI